jgi:hypothetical protein
MRRPHPSMLLAMPLTMADDVPGAKRMGGQFSWAVAVAAKAPYHQRSDARSGRHDNPVPHAGLAPLFRWRIVQEYSANV